MRDCRWAARRISAYRDAATSPVLTHGEILRLERHLMVCSGCLDVARELAWLADALHLYGGGADDADATARLQAWASTTFGRTAQNGDTA